MTRPLKWGDRKKLPADRSGVTRDIRLADLAIHLTVNRYADGSPAEMFAKVSHGWQGWTDVLCVTASLAMQYGCPLDVILKHWRHRRFAPDGLIGQAKSIPDAIAGELTDGH